MQKTKITVPEPDRNGKGRLSFSYFKELIVYYVQEHGQYKPAGFKAFVETLGILSKKDWERMPTRKYAEWKHNVDAAKQGLLRDGTLIQGNGG